MSTTKSKSSSAETPNKKASPATPVRISKLSKGVTKSETDSPSPLQTARISIDRSPRTSIDRSPRTVNSKLASDAPRSVTKPSIEWRSPKLSTPEQTRSFKGSELQAQLTLIQEELTKAKEKLAIAEKDKVQVVNELKDAQKLAEGANEKLKEALLAQKRAEEDSEIEKFRALEMEQVGIEATQKKEEEWKKEIEDVKNQHAIDVAALLSTTQELQKLKQELTKACDAKNQALTHADDATKIAEIHAEKVEILSAEITRLKDLLDSTVESKDNDKKKLLSELNSEIDSLKLELERAKSSEAKFVEREASIEKLNVDLDAAKMAEAYARNLVEEWKQKVEEVEIQVEEAKTRERSASDSLDSFMKQLEGSQGLLQKSEDEVADLKEKIATLEASIGKHKGDLEESERRFNLASEEASQLEKMIDSIKIELETMREEKIQALENEKLAASKIQSLLEEKNNLKNELETSKDEEEKIKKAMDSLTAALHEVSSEAREAKENLLSIKAEHESSQNQIEDLKCVLKATNEKYEAMLDEAKHEVDVLLNTVEHSRHEFEESKAEWEQKELHLMNCVKQAEADNSSLEKEVNMLENSLREAKRESKAVVDEGSRLKDNLKEAENEMIHLKEVLGEAKAESMKLKENILAKESELQDIIQENEDLRLREAASAKKVEDLSKLLEEAIATKKAEENGELSDSEKDYDLLPKVVEFSEENGNGTGIDEKFKMGFLSPKHDESSKEKHHEKNDHIDEDVTVQPGSVLFENVNENSKEVNGESKEVEVVEGEFKMWESCKIDEKDYSPERETEPESFEEEADSKDLEGGDSFDQGNCSSENLENGNTSPSKQQQQKKKKPLLRKFGNLLKKKSPSSHK